MRTRSNRRRCLQQGLVGVLIVSLLAPAPLGATTLTLRNGMQFEGEVGKIAGLSDGPGTPITQAGEIKVTPVIMIDDELRRTFFPSREVAAVAEGQAARLERIEIDQRVPRGGTRIASVGSILRITPWDEWGRRIFTMNTPRGPLDIVQGITEVTPEWTKVESLQGKNSYIWDMRIATSSIPREVLSNVFMKHINPKDPEQRLRLVRLYIQAERFKDARIELEKALEDFPELADLKTQIRALHQARARRLLREIEQRRDAGQHVLAYNMLSKFPSDGVAGETLIKVREMLATYDKRLGQMKTIIQEVEKLIEQLQDAESKDKLVAWKEELERELNIHNLDRMAAFVRFIGDSKLSADQRLAIGLSGWILGSSASTENLAVATSLLDVRLLVYEYLGGNHRPHEREAMLEKLASLEGGTPANLALLIEHMKPPVVTEAEPVDEIPGFFELTADGLPGEDDVSYYVQLPPEYNPYRKYPCIVTLNGAGTSARMQVDWWAGVHSEGATMRFGQGSRQGYIVIAPKWTKEHQRSYEYSVREHAAVLLSLNDAIKRFSIDTDRVFLSGHSMGGDAVWDIGLAHPDLWAGIVPIVASSDKYIARYWENGRGLPMYFVGGEMDHNRMAENARDLDRYLTKSGYDVIIVEYKGRGHEHFQDEIQRIFEWTGYQKRNFFQREIECVSMRPWDNYFWWLEFDRFPDRSMVLPVNWPDSNARPALIEARALENNRLVIRTSAGKTSVWLSPKLVDFSQRIEVSVNGRSNDDEVRPSAKVLLEDVRKRGDRQNPFWAKVEVQSGRTR